MTRFSEDTVKAISHAVTIKNGLGREFYFSPNCHVGPVD